MRDIPPDTAALPGDIETSKERAEFQHVLWQNIHVGDILKITGDEWVPADMMLLNSSMEEGVCYIQTANLDG